MMKRIKNHIFSLLSGYAFVATIMIKSKAVSSEEAKGE
jgi:hypothetical protein